MLHPTLVPAQTTRRPRAARRHGDVAGAGAGTERERTRREALAREPEPAPGHVATTVAFDRAYDNTDNLDR